jgi:hypothetical protein
VVTTTAATAPGSSKTSVTGCLDGTLVGIQDGVELLGLMLGEIEEGEPLLGLPDDGIALGALLEGVELLGLPDDGVDVGTDEGACVGL